MAEIFASMPKVELHAHLNGSLSEKTVRDLIASSKKDVTLIEKTAIQEGSKRTLKGCFDMFKVIQKLTDNSEAIKFATKSVIADFVDDGVYYLELRSTPRCNTVTGLTKRCYIEAVLEGIQEYLGENPDIIDVRFLLSIDRRQGVKEAEDTAQLAVEYMASSHGLVVGIDFSGDPNVGDAREYFDVLKNAKDSGLKLALHMAERPGLDDENIALLNLPPDRIGHGTFLHEDSQCENIVKKCKIPIEICLTSNVKGGTVASYAEEHHHIHRWRKCGQPLVLCTDDKGVFSTTLSKEYRIAASECEMSWQEMFDLSKGAIEFVFANDDAKLRLKNRWKDWKQQNEHLFT